MWAARIQMAVDVLVKIFEQVGPCKSLGKTVSMACHPYSAIGDHSIEAYGSWMIVEGLIHR